MRKDVIEIEVQLSHDTNIVAACPADRVDRLDRQLELVGNVDRAGIDRAGGAFLAAEIGVSVDRFHSTIGTRRLMNSGRPKSCTLDFR